MGLAPHLSWDVKLLYCFSETKSASPFESGVSKRIVEIGTGLAVDKLICYNEDALRAMKREGEKMTKENKIQEQGSPIQLPSLEGLVKPVTDAEIQQLATLGEEITLADAEELSPIFPRDIPKVAIDKQNTKSRLKEILLIPKKLQKWRHKR